MLLVGERDGCHAGRWYAMSEQTIFGGLRFVEEVIRHVLPGRIVGSPPSVFNRTADLELKPQRIISGF